MEDAMLACIIAMLFGVMLIMIGINGDVTGNNSNDRRDSHE